VAGVQAVAGQQPCRDRAIPARSSPPHRGVSGLPVDVGVVPPAAIHLDEYGARHEDVVAAALGGAEERPDRLGTVGPGSGAGQAPQRLAVPRPPYTYRPGKPNPAVMQMLARGVVARVLYQAGEVAAFEAEAFRAETEAYHRAGVQARVVEELPMKLVVVDAKVAMMTMTHPLRDDAAFPATLLIEHPGHARFAAAAFEQYWAEGQPYARLTSIAGVDGGADVRRAQADRGTRRGSPLNENSSRPRERAGGLASDSAKTDSTQHLSATLLETAQSPVLTCVTGSDVAER
jgi:hypothetical protein